MEVSKPAFERVGALLLAVFWLLLAVQAQNPGNENSPEAERELQTGITLTRAGQFQDAIPHFLTARGKVKEVYAENFNLSLCYLGTAQYESAISILHALQSAGHDTADVNNLLAQAYIGAAQPEAAFAALQKAAQQTPNNEKLYVFVADACTDHQNYSLGLKAVDLGLKNLPNSARLHYERAMFLSSLDEFDLARADFDKVGTLTPDSALASVALAQKLLYAGQITSAVTAARAGVKKDSNDFRLLTILGESLLRSGVSPGQPEFAEAQSSLEKAITLRPQFSGSHLALGKLYLLQDRASDSIAQLELARALDPNNAAVYSNLAKAYQRSGNPVQAQAMLSALAKLNQAQAEKISSAPGDRKVGYGQAPH